MKRVATKSTRAALACCFSAALAVAPWAMPESVHGKSLNQASALTKQQTDEIPADVRDKMNALNSSDPVERASAACALGEMGARAVPAIPFLIKTLGDDTPVSHDKCWENGSSRKLNIKASAKTSPGERAAHALAVIGRPAVEPLIAVLKVEDWRVRDNAAWALGIISDPRTVEPLIASLKDQDWHVRRESAWGLGLKKDQRSIEPLIVALGDREWEVRKQAAWALGLQGDERAVEPLNAALKDERWEVREQAAWSLGLKGDERAVEPLSTALSDKEWQVRKEAAWALGLKGDERAVEPLLSALKDEHWEVRAQAAWALGLKGDRRAVAALKTALHDREEEVRDKAAWALQLIGFKVHGPEAEVDVEVN
jgi:HEAT repeat protein